MDTNEYKNIISNSKDCLELKFPKIIELQTMSFCNANCIVCPYRSLKIENVRMSDQHLSKILEEINNHNEEVERVIPYLNNEPSFDTRLLSILKEIKNMNIETEISSNISNFKIDDLKTIVDQNLIDDFRISFFGDTKELYNKLMPGLNYEKNVEVIKALLEYNKLYGNKIPIEIIIILLPSLDALKIINGIKSLFNYDKIHPFGFLDRCGNVEIEKNNKINDNENYKIIGCKLNRPFERCCIYADGNVVLCSQDWEKAVVLGNVFESSIEEVWNSKKAVEIREIILGQKKYPTNFLCTKCKLSIIEKDNHQLQNFQGDKYMDIMDNKKLILK